jgi:hypothetical protein
MKNNSNEENGVSGKLVCSFPCYRLIPLNELALNILNIKNIKSKKKFPDISGPSDQVIRAGLSGQNAGMGVYGFQSVWTHRGSGGGIGQPLYLSMGDTGGIGQPLYLSMGDTGGNGLNICPKMPAFYK